MPRTLYERWRGRAVIERLKGFFEVLELIGGKERTVNMGDNWQSKESIYLDPKKIECFLNKHIIIGVTVNDHKGNLLERIQKHGKVIRINEKEGIVIKLHNSNEEYFLPPDFRAIKDAPPGEYRFKSTGEIIVNPDLMTSWTMTKPAPN